MSFLLLVSFAREVFFQEVCSHTWKEMHPSSFNPSVKCLQTTPKLKSKNLSEMIRVKFSCEKLDVRKFRAKMSSLNVTHKSGMADVQMHLCMAQDRKRGRIGKTQSKQNKLNEELCKTIGYSKDVHVSSQETSAQRRKLPRIVSRYTLKRRCTQGVCLVESKKNKKRPCDRIENLGSAERHWCCAFRFSS